LGLTCGTRLGQRPPWPRHRVRSALHSQQAAFGLHRGSLSARAHGAAFNDIGLHVGDAMDKRVNNRIQNSYVPVRRRERKRQLMATQPEPLSQGAYLDLSTIASCQRSTVRVWGGRFQQYSFSQEHLSLTSACRSTEPSSAGACESPCAISGRARPRPSPSFASPVIRRWRHRCRRFCDYHFSLHGSDRLLIP
jgi:hypothetical protein